MDLEITEPNLSEEIAVRIEAGEFGKVENVRDLLERIPMGRELVIAQAFRSLGARKYYWDKATNAMKFEPDCRTAMDAVKFLSALQDGLPTQTTLNVNVNKGAGPSEADLEAALSASPALKSRLQKLIGPA